MIKLLLCLILAFPAQAISCPKPVQYIKKDKLANCTGYLFSPQKEREVRIKVAEYDLLKEYSNTQKEINEILTKRLQNTQEYNEYLSKRLKEEKKSTELMNALYFGLGVLVTGIIASNVGK